MSTSKRILVFGGTSLYRRDLYRLLALELGAVIRVCQEFSRFGIKEYEIDQEFFVESVCEKTKLFGAIHWYKAYFKDLSKYDIVIVAGPTTLNNWILLFLKRYLRIKVISWSHGIYGREGRLRLGIKSLYYSLCDLNLVYNNYALNLLVDSGIMKEKVYVVGNCVNKPNIRKIQLSIEQRELFKNNIILFVGRITTDKRVDLLINAFNRVKLERPGLKLVLVGPLINSGGSCRIEDFGSDIHFLGPVYDDNLLRYYFQNSLLCVSPGNIGLTAISSILEGCPVITHNNFSYQGPEFECIVSGENGFFFEYNDVESLAVVIEKALRTDFDRELIKSKAGSMWSVESEVEKIEHALSNL